MAEFFLGSDTARFQPWQAVRDARWKCIRYVGMEEMHELYDLQADPLEMRNLVEDTRAREALKRMQTELQRLIAEDAK